MAKILQSFITLFIVFIFQTGTSVIAEEDLRAYQHGIDFVPMSNGNYQLIWASSGNPPTGPDSNGNWTHDIYYSTINPSNPPVSPQNNAVTIISRGEAQEPASSAVTDDGHIMLTLEDGYLAPNWVAQRYGVYGENFTNNPKPYDDVNTSVYEGGHSGHVAAAGNRFIVFWSDDWHGPNDNPPGPAGADGIGVGRHVLVDTYTSEGNHVYRKNIAVDDSSYDWWPMVAASRDRACLVWQRHVQGDDYSKLMYAIYNPTDNTLTKNVVELQDYTRYYTYDVQYYPDIDRFLVVGTYYNGGGYAYLLETNGNIVDSITTLPTGIRESQPSIKAYTDGVLAVYPKSPNGLLSLKLTAEEVSIHEQINHNHNWQYMGSDGIFIDNNTIYIAALCSSGIETFTVDVTPLAGQEPPAGEAEICTWKDNKAAALTLTYDDAIIDGLTKFEKLHDMYGLKGSIGVVSTWSDTGMHQEGYPVATWPQLQDFISRGTFDISSHTYNHINQISASEDLLCKEYDSSRSTIENNLGIIPRTLIYPYYDYRPHMGSVADNFFIAARGGDGDNDQDGNPRLQMNLPGQMNYYDLMAFSIYESTPAQEMKQHIDQHINANAWLIVVLHSCDGEGYSPPPLSVVDETYQYYAAKSSQVWNGFFEEVAKYERERCSADVTVVSSTPYQITLSLTDTLKNSVYDFPLTLKVKVPASWNNILVKQNGVTTSVSPFNQGLQKFVYCDAIPDKGVITLTQIPLGFRISQE